uniref:NADH dehydrogenase subunit 6 n=1 Tax=Ruditapes philippinarum TaxID=129788 RepID=A0A6N0I542_RUDPH|nr:NADH dehydrogenase subunit 6 [Ruditapes philippinarum]
MVCCLSSFSIILKYNHPMYYGMALVFVVVNVSVFLAYYSGLYGFMLFMSVASGVLVVFAYSIALIPLLLKKKEALELFSESVMKSKTSFIFKVWMFMISITLMVGIFVMVMVVNPDTGGGSFSGILYMSEGWGLGMVIMGLFMFLLMVFCVSVAGKYKGALIK